MRVTISPLKGIKLAIGAALSEQTSGVIPGALVTPQILPIEPPRHAGYSTPVCFDIASARLKGDLADLEETFGKKAARKALKEKSSFMAADLAEDFARRLAWLPGTLPGLSRVAAESGYINFYFDVPYVSREIIQAVLESGAEFGKISQRNERVMVEYSQPNTHKAFHIGHTRNVALGIALGNILEYAGYPVVLANYIGDIGAHVIKCLWAIMEFPNAFGDEKDKGKRLGEFYSLADRIESDEEAIVEGRAVAYPKEKFDAGIRELFARWESGDPEIADLWKRTRAESLESFDRIYGILGARFDHVFFESEYEKQGKTCVAELLEKGIAEIGAEGEYAGAVFVDFDQKLPGNGLRQMVLLRTDGTSLYQTKELALAKDKFEKFAIDRSIYVVASEQIFYFRQIFAILKLWGFPQADLCVHLPYEIVTLPEGKMSSRSGNVVHFDDLLEETLSLLEHITEEKGYASNAREEAYKIAVGAIKFSMLNVDHNKVLVFDWNQALNFSGQAAPYVQYMCVRARRILDEAKYNPDAAAIPEVVPAKEESELAILLGMFPDVVEEAARQYAPYMVTRYVFTASQKFGEFYRFCPVLKSDPPLRDWRLALVAAFSAVSEKCMSLLGISIPEAM